MVVGFLRGGCGVFKGGGNWGTLRIPREDWGTLGKIREPPPLGTPPLNNPIKWGVPGAWHSLCCRFRSSKVRGAQTLRASEASKR